MACSSDGARAALRLWVWRPAFGGRRFSWQGILAMVTAADQQKPRRVVARGKMPSPIG